jgi:hypothetical protein
MMKQERGGALATLQAARTATATELVMTVPLCSMLAMIKH